MARTPSLEPLAPMPASSATMVSSPPRDTAINTQRITDDLDRLLEVLPQGVQDALREAEARDQLLEVVLDLGRVPEARYPGRAVPLGAAVVERLSASIA